MTNIISYTRIKYGIIIAVADAAACAKNCKLSGGVHALKSSWPLYDVQRGVYYIQYIGLFKFPENPRFFIVNAKSLFRTIQFIPQTVCSFPSALHIDEFNGSWLVPSEILN